jgi:hypothetical protein
MLYLGEAECANRVALVVGNSNYKVGALKNPVNDASDIASKLEKLGFEVTLLKDADRRSFDQQIREFRNNLKNADIRLFYYAGHGMQVDGINYLIPTDTNIQFEDEVKYEAVDMRRVMDSMASAGKGANVIILDACRNNPFTRSFRATSQGLARMPELDGSIIVYSTSPGKVASDGSDRNGLFTEQLLRYIDRTDLTLDQLFKKVGKAVSKATGNEQRPWMSVGLYEDIYLASIHQDNMDSGARLSVIDGEIQTDMGGYTEFRLWKTFVNPKRVKRAVGAFGKKIIVIGPINDKINPNQIKNGFSSIENDISIPLKEIFSSKEGIDCVFSPSGLHDVGLYKYDLQPDSFNLIWGVKSPNLESVKELAREMNCDNIIFFKFTSTWWNVTTYVWVYDVKSGEMNRSKKISSLSSGYRNSIKSDLKKLLDPII